MIHNLIKAPAFRLDLKSTPHSFGTTVAVLTTWPLANHPEAQTKFSVTLTPEQLVRLRNAIDEMVHENHRMAAASATVTLPITC